MSDSYGTASLVGNRAVIRLERRLPRPVDDLWRTVTDPVEMRSWFPTRIEIDSWHVGATMTHHFDGHDIEPLHGAVLIWEPPHRVRFTWGDDSLELRISPEPDGSARLVLTEELSPAHAARNIAGWEGCLDNLEYGSEQEPWQVRFDRYSEAFEPTLGPQDGPPEGYREDADRQTGP